MIEGDGDIRGTSIRLLPIEETLSRGFPSGRLLVEDFLVGGSYHSLTKHGEPSWYSGNIDRGVDNIICWRLWVHKSSERSCGQNWKV